jgi:hypothetical protein
VAGGAVTGGGEPSGLGEQVAQVFDGVAAAIDDRVPVADTVGNDVLVDDSRGIRRAAALFAGCAVLLVPWTIYLAATLPSRQLSPHHAAAWVGYDILLFAALATTAGAALRRSRHLSTVAGWSAAMLTIDAWFDVMTSPTTTERLQGGAAAVLVELPLAGVCLWLSARTQQVADRRLRLLRIAGSGPNGRRRNA